jgi:transketolase
MAIEPEVKALYKCILDVAFKYKLSHLGSYFSSLLPIYEIYTKRMMDGDIFILSSGHAALAQYAVLERVYGKTTTEELYKKHGGHPHLDEQSDLYCSTGSLGMGITVAVGRALANPTRTVHVMISDGECAEGSVWEALQYIDKLKLSNIAVYVNANGYSAYDSVDTQRLNEKLQSFLPGVVVYQTSVGQFPFLRGLNAHYHVMSEADYKLALEILENS